MKSALRCSALVASLLLLGACTASNVSVPATDTGEDGDGGDGDGDDVDPGDPGDTGGDNGGGSGDSGSGNSSDCAAGIKAGANWRYAKGTAEPPANWTAIAFDDSAWLVGPTGIGYGDGNDATVLTDMRYAYVSVYLRHSFDLGCLPTDVKALTLEVTYDDAFVA